MFKRRIAVLLTAAMVMTGLPATGSVAYAASGDILADELTTGDILADEPSTGDVPADELTTADIPKGSGPVSDADDIFPLPEADEDLPPYVTKDKNANPETVSVREMEQYIADGTWDERVAFMERLRDEQLSLNDRLVQNAGIYTDDVARDLAAEPVTGIDHIMPSEGEVNTLLITVEFKDYNFTDDYRNRVSEIFKPDSDSASKENYYPYESLTAYYERSSFDKLHLKGDVFNFISDQDRSYYDEKDGNNKLLNYEITEWLKETILSANKAEGKSETEMINDFMKKYDKDGDRQVDGAYLLYAGPHSGWGTQWWSYKYDPNIKLGDYLITNLVMNAAAGSDDGNDTPESWENRVKYYDVQFSASTFIHETGHMLGLDDYYNYDSGEGGSYCADMMNDTIGDHNAYSKVLLGWIDKNALRWVTGSGSYSLDPYAINGDALFITTPSEREANKDKNNGIYSRFILAEHFRNTGNDRIDLDDSIKDGIRLFRVYGRLNDNGDGFVTTNTKSDQIPFYRGYSAEAGKNQNITSTNSIVPDTASAGESNSVAEKFYRIGDELTEEETWFHYDPSNNAKLSGAYGQRTGISITGISELSGDAITLSVNFAAKDAPKANEGSMFGTVSDNYVAMVSYNKAVAISREASFVLYECDDEGMPGRKVADIPVSDVTVLNDPEHYVQININKEWIGNRKYILVIGKGSFYSSDDTHLFTEEYSITCDNSKIWGYTAVPVADHKGGLYKPADKEGVPAVKVSLSCATTGAKIYYTVDGSVPSADNENTKDYDGNPIEIAGSMVLTAIAEAEGLAPSAPMTEEYFVEGLKPARDSLTLSIPGVYSINPHVTPLDAEVIYESTDKSVVTVSDRGLVRSVKAGSAQINIRTKNGAKASVKVTVTDAKSDAYKEIKELYGSDDEETVESIIKDYGDDKTIEDIRKDVTVSTNGSTRVWAARISDQTYTGSALKPQVNVYDGFKLLDEGTDYTVSYKNNKNVSTDKKHAIATVRFKGDYKATEQIPVSFYIVPAGLDSDIAVLSGTAKASNKSKAFTPALIWKNSGKSCKLNKKEFKVTLKDPDGKDVEGTSVAGQYTGTVEAIGTSFAGSARFDIYVGDGDWKLISDAKVTIRNKSFVYTGLPITLAPDKYSSGILVEEGDISILDGNGKPLTKDEYSIDYYNNTEPGKATAVITGIGGWSGQRSVTFTITKGKPINASAVKVKISEGAYSKAGSRPELVIKDNQSRKQLKEGTDYTLSFKYDKKNPLGDKAGTVIIKGKGLYKDSIVESFPIRATDIRELLSETAGNFTDPDVKVRSLPDDFYAKALSANDIPGDCKNPKIVLTQGGKKLKQGVDFELDEASYYKPVSSNSIDVIIKGINNYTGEFKYSYQVITKDYDISRAKIGKIAPKAYTGREIVLSGEELEGLVTLNNTPVRVYTVKEYNDADDPNGVLVTYMNNIRSGKATVSFKGVGKYGGVKAAKFNIESKKGEVVK